MIFDCRKNHGEGNLLEENRLIFFGPRGKGSVEFGGKSEKSKGRRPHDALRKLRESLGEKSKKTKPKQRYVPNRGDLVRDLDKQRSSKPESRKAVKESLDFQGLLKPDVLDNMTKLNHWVSAQYMNPAFMMYMRTHFEGTKKNVADKVLDTMMQVIEDPREFTYRYNKKTGEATIVGKRGSKYKGTRLVLSSLNGKKFNVIQVNEHNIKGAGGRLPWENVKYVGKMKHFEESYWNAYSKIFNPKIAARYKTYFASAQDAAAGKALQAGGKEDQLSTLVEIGKNPKMQEIFLHTNVILPLRLIKLIESRDYKWENQDHDAIKQLKAQKAGLKVLEKLIMEGKTAEAYKMLTRDRAKYYKVWVQPHPDMKKAYLVGFNGRSSELSFHESGLLMDKDKGGKWKIDPRYEGKIKRDYYKETQRTKPKKKVVDLTEKDPAAYKAKEARIQKEALEVDKRRKNLEYAQPAIKKLKGAPLDVVAKAWIALSPKDAAKMNEMVTYSHSAHAAQYNPTWGQAVAKALVPPLIEEMTQSKTNTNKINAAI